MGLHKPTSQSQYCLLSYQRSLSSGCDSQPYYPPLTTVPIFCFGILASGLLYVHSPTKEMYPWLKQYEPLNPSVLQSTYQGTDTSSQQDSIQTVQCTCQVLISLAPPATGILIVWIQIIQSYIDLNNYLLTCSPFLPYAIPRP